MDFPDSHRISVPRGTQEQEKESGSISSTGVSPSSPGLSSTVKLSTRFVTPWGFRSNPHSVLQPPHSNACRLSRCTSLGLSLFARHYSGNNFFSSRYLDVSVPSVPSSLPMCSAGGTWAFPQVGFPIRASPDQRLSRLPEAYRSLPRPSSAFDAKASTVSP